MSILINKDTKVITQGITGQPAFFQPHLGAFIGYLLAHECMHHGEIGLIVGQHGGELPLEVVWNWSHK